MRNLKRALSLALAAMMLIGMMAVSAGAASKDFTDADEIDHTEAVNTLVALDIISGKEDGSYFDPTGIVTRAEMAKMITIAMNGGKEPVLGVKDKPTFSDIDGHWAETYIEYCTSMKIISGRGNGTFDPNATVTAAEAAKMILTALGYDAAVFMLTGDSWQSNTDMLANDIQLYKNLEDISSSTPLTRDNAAQLVFNGLNAKVMEKTYDKVLSDGTISYNYSLGAQTLLAKKYNTSEATGILTGVSYNSDKDEYTYTVTDADGNRNYTTDTDCGYLYQMQVKVLYKVENGKTTVYGIFSKDSSVLTSGIVGDITAPAATAEKVKIDGTEYKLSDEAQNIEVYEFLTGAVAESLDEIGTYATAANKKVAYTFELIDNDGDDKGDALIVYPFTVAKVTYVGTKTFTAGTSYEFDDVNAYTGLAKNDWVKITAAANTVDDTAVIEKVAVVEAKAQAVKGSDVQFNGEWYDMSLVTAVTAGASCEYVAVNGYLFYIDATNTTLGAADFVVVTAVANNAAGLDNTYTTKLLKSDGTTTTVEANNKGTVGSIYTFEVDDDGYYDLTAAPAGDVSATTDYDDAFNGGTYNVASGSTKGSITASGTTYYLADDAVVFVKDGTDYSVTNGAKLKATKTAVTVTYFAVDADSASGYDYVKLAYVESGSLGTTSDSYAYVTGDVVKYQDANDDDKYYVEIPVGEGEVLTTVSKTAGGSTVVDTAYALAKGDVIKYTVNGDGKVDSISVYAMGTLAATSGAANFTAAIVGYSDTNIRFSSAYFTDGNGAVTGTSVTYDATLTDDTVYIYVDSSDNAVIEGGSIQLASSNVVSGVTSDYANAMVVTNGDGEVVLLVIDVNNDVLDVQ